MDLSQSKGEWKIRIERATHVPLTLGGKAKFMIANVLATLASYVWDSKRRYYLSYKLHSSAAAQTPGRMNIFEFKNSKC
jgi:cyanophycin synthetase